jgi:hypothetical protein
MRRLGVEPRERKSVGPLVTLLVLNVLLWAMIAYGTFVVYDDRRYLLRHGQDYDDG